MGHTVPHWKDHSSDKIESRMLNYSSTLNICQSVLKISNLLHKQGFVEPQLLRTICTTMDICLHTVTYQALWKWGNFERANICLKYYQLLELMLYFGCRQYRVCNSKDFKVTICQRWSSQEKVCTSAIPAELSAKAFSLSSSSHGVESFSKFDRWQLCSSQISCIKRSTPLLKFVKSSRGWQHFKSGFCPFKVTSFS